jgi:hypothetical protein
MDDFEVIRFVAMVIITNSAYHASSPKKRPFFRAPFTVKRWRPTLPPRSPVSSAELTCNRAFAAMGSLFHPGAHH